MGKGDIFPSGLESSDTITISGSSEDIILDDLSIDMSTINIPSSTNYYYSTGPSITTGATGSSSNFYTINTTAGINGSWGSIGSVGSTGSSGLYVQTDAEFQGDVKIKGKSIAKTLDKIEERLAILQDPDPEKLEKFAALKKAYDNYKMIERLIGDYDGTEESK